MQELHDLRAGGFQNAALALAPRTLKSARFSRIEGGYFSTCGSRYNAAHMRLFDCKSFTD
eukprot:8098930-Pyramimonas_sp.AAC.1